YKKAIDTLVHLHQLPSDSASLSKYDDNMLVKESLRFIDFYIEVLNGDRISAALREEFIVILKHLLSLTKTTSNVVVLRDYHADNLMWLEDREGHNKVGILDFQDAVIGTPVYDMVSLLEDARRDVPSKITEKMFSRYLHSFPNISSKEFAASYAIYGVQRNLKIVGVFARLATLHKNRSYLFLLPRVWRHINNDLRHPLLLPLKNWLQKVVPMQLKI
ncbi:MAG: phosphotransferase, partial [Pseudomonadota bacterium]